jgi:hypothetical protein
MHKMRLRRHLIAALLFAAACNSPTGPAALDTGSQPRGRLAGTVTIGPNCPGPETPTPCPPHPDAYAMRKILVYNEAKTTLLHTVDIDARGGYSIDLMPAKYTIDFRGTAIDLSSDLPKTVEIHANSVTTLNVAIDTGIR